MSLENALFRNKGVNSPSINECTTSRVSEQSPDLNNNNSISGNPIDTPAPREKNKISLNDSQQLTDPKTNDFKIINVSLPKQPSTTQRKEHSYINLTRGTNMPKNKTPLPKLQAATKNTNNDQHNLPLKNSTYCPFLKRKGRCLKGNRCDFFHPKRSPTPKY